MYHVFCPCIWLAPMFSLTPIRCDLFIRRWLAKHFDISAESADLLILFFMSLSFRCNMFKCFLKISFLSSRDLITLVFIFDKIAIFSFFQKESFLQVFLNIFLLANYFLKPALFYIIWLTLYKSAWYFKISALLNIQFAQKIMILNLPLEFTWVILEKKRKWLDVILSAGSY